MRLECELIYKYDPYNVNSIFCKRALLSIIIDCKVPRAFVYGGGVAVSMRAKKFMHNLYDQELRS